MCWSVCAAAQRSTGSGLEHASAEARDAALGAELWRLPTALCSLARPLSPSEAAGAAAEAAAAAKTPAKKKKGKGTPGSAKKKASGGGAATRKTKLSR